MLGRSSNNIPPFKNMNNKDSNMGGDALDALVSFGSSSTFGNSSRKPSFSQNQSGYTSFSSNQPGPNSNSSLSSLASLSSSSSSNGSTTSRNRSSLLMTGNTALSSSKGNNIIEPSQPNTARYNNNNSMNNYNVTEQKTSIRESDSKPPLPQYSSSSSNDKTNGSAGPLPAGPRRLGSRFGGTLDLDISLNSNNNNNNNREASTNGSQNASSSPPSTSSSQSRSNNNNYYNNGLNSISSKTSAFNQSPPTTASGQSNDNNSYNSNNNNNSLYTPSAPKAKTSNSNSNANTSSNNNNNNSTQSSNQPAPSSSSNLDDLGPAANRRIATLYTCPTCNRSFKRQSFAKHQAVCSKVFGSKRSAFDARAQRSVDENGNPRPTTSAGERPATTATGRQKNHDDIVVGDDHEGSANNENENSGGPGAGASDKEINWRESSSALREAMKAAKKQKNSGIDMKAMGNDIQIFQKPMKPNIPKPVA